jgi:hypothetical protein
VIWNLHPHSKFFDKKYQLDFSEFFGYNKNKNQKKGSIIMKFRYRYFYNENSGTSQCDIIYKHRCFTGRAFIHPEDRDV